MAKKFFEQLKDLLSLSSVEDAEHEFDRMVDAQMTKDVDRMTPSERLNYQYEKAKLAAEQKVKQNITGKK